MTDTPKLSLRWRGTSKEARVKHMRALARARMAKLSKRARRAIAMKLVAARRAKHGNETNHA